MKDIPMRVMFTTTPQYGHFHPLVPFARALADAGHELAFAAPVALADAMTHGGFRHVPAGTDRDINEVFPQLRTWRGPERVAFMGREVFGGLWPREMVPAILDFAVTWAP